ncbi:inactive tyrosine-protein kinase transmembrane receptor ROR1-like isoform X2 [Orbicella faveolata]|uniref:inactive tyrosine-protein kinase transmembrane receptor ROR1-like isoform X2 n=1 Tax=Orbicella faveolata TaxID=48498 RepID=UPI0009E61689|nr:inactive tyrosine-protein kinase transmembrane receptor ROR1-like isoform X2 [Orbicella faveolata]
MKLVASLLCIFLVVDLSCVSAAAQSKNSRKGSRSRTRGRNSKFAACELYSGGELCKPYLDGQRVYVNSKTASQVSHGSRVGRNYDMLKEYVSDGCKDYVLPTLCNYAFPPCDSSQSKPKPRKFCRDDCLVLKNDICQEDFERARKLPFVSVLLPDCSSMPAVGHPDYKSCIRVVPQVPKFKVRLDNNITMFENKPVIFKCRLSSKKVAANITWFKDGRSVSEAYPSYKVTTFRWGSRLRIRRAKKKDAGIFQCRAKGPGGMATAQAWLKINGFLNTPPITINTDPIHVKPETGRPEPGPVRTLPPLQGMCESYRGDACAEFIGNQSIWVQYRIRHQQTIEKQLSSALTVIRTLNQMSERCTRFGIPAMCFHLFPTCDARTQDSKPRLCREDCFALFEDVCLAELNFAQMDKKFSALLPNCSALPKRNSKDYSYCTSLGIPGLSTPTTASLPVLSAPGVQDCYNGTGASYTGRMNVTKSGRPCLEWPYKDLPHNFCRNPEGLGARPWCYVGPENEVELCDVKKCSDISPAVNTGYKQTQEQVRPVGRTIYVISAIMAVLIVAFLSIIVYLKVQHRKSALPQKQNTSSGSISKSTQSTVQQPSFDLKQSISEIKSCVFNQDQEVSHGKVKFLESLGEGGFAKVCKGALIKLESDQEDVKIAIKRLKSDVPQAAVENFKKETSILANLQDINILCLIGVSTGEEPRYMVFEYYTDMDLYRFLLDNASKLSGLIPSDISEYDLLLDFSLQVASGMDFLVENNFVHCDLAARNCYVTEGNIIKISNLGIGSYKYPSDYSWGHSSALLPVRWMPPEALNTLQFSHMSDVWSYGILLWEIYSFGCRPYVGFTNQEAIERIRNLQLLTCPDSCPARLFGLMRECWEENPSDRPQFTEICSRLRQWAGDSIAESH